MEGDELIRSCEFATDRILVGEWHVMSEQFGIDLTTAVTAMLSRATTEGLPYEWRGDYPADRAGRWIPERDEESPTLLAIEGTTGEAIGLLILFADDSEDAAGVHLRLGYLLAETAWGRGFATELVRGLVVWARSQPVVRSISAGVAQANVASARVLTKNGFTPDSNPASGERLYSLEISH